MRRRCVPRDWMSAEDGVWRKGGSKPEMSSMVSERVRVVEKEERGVIERCFEEVRRFDALLGG
jgi:hypothetical protein